MPQNDNTGEFSPDLQAILAEEGIAEAPAEIQSENSGEPRI